MEITRDAILLYAQRNATLIELGYRTYEEYLISPLWRRLRAKAMMHAKKSCFACGSVAVQVHHRSYSRATLKGKKPENLVAVCDSCHDRAEFQNGVKVGPTEANRVLDNIRAARLQPRPGIAPPTPKNQSPAQRKAQRRRAAREATTPTWVPPAFLANPDCVARTKQARIDEKAARRAKHEERTRLEQEAARIRREGKAFIRDSRPKFCFFPRCGSFAIGRIPCGLHACARHMIAVKSS